MYKYAIFEVEKSVYRDMVEQKIAEVQALYNRVDLSKSYKAMFSSLWYGTNPCTLVNGITGDKIHYDTSVLKYCQWRGIPIECAAIFQTFPTDSGVCCSFNLKAAEDIYKGERYTHLVKNLQGFEKQHSLFNSSLPDWYSNSDEPKTLSGKKNGLFVMLDAHSDVLAATSLNQDYTSFTGLLSYSGSFPLMAQGEFDIIPGHHTL